MDSFSTRPLVRALARLDLTSTLKDFADLATTPVQPALSTLLRTVSAARSTLSSPIRDASATTVSSWIQTESASLASSPARLAIQAPSTLVFHAERQQSSTPTH